MLEEVNPSRGAAGQEVDPSLRSLPWLQLRRGGLIENSSQTLESLLGFGSGELRNRPFSLIFPESERIAELPESQSIVAAAQGEFTSPARLLHKAGRLINVTLFCKRLANASRLGMSVPYSVPLLVVVLDRGAE